MSITCQKRDCGRAGTHALQLGCGTFTDAEEAPPRAKILMGIILCEECLEEETAEKWLEVNPALGQLMTLAMSGGPPPDLARAVVLGVPIDSADYRRLQLEQLNQRSN